MIFLGTEEENHAKKLKDWLPYGSQNFLYGKEGQSWPFDQDWPVKITSIYI